MLLEHRYIKTPYKCSEPKLLYLALRGEMQQIYCVVGDLLQIENNKITNVARISIVKVVEKRIYPD